MRPSVRVVGGGLIVLWAVPVIAGTGVTAEAVDHYPVQGYSTIKCIDEATGYFDTLTLTSGTIFTQSAYYTDNNVYDSDFIDPESASIPGGNDTNNFDRPGEATAYFCGHGNCNDQDNYHYCYHNSDCAISGYTTVCMSNGPVYPTIGNCTTLLDHEMQVNDVPQSIVSGSVIYSGGSLVRLGENPTSGGWAGAGTNGGAHFPIISNSCGIRPTFLPQISQAMFAGASIVGMFMPVTRLSDLCDETSRGTHIAQTYTANPYSGVSVGFNTAIASLSQTSGGSCPTYPNGPGHTYTNGGGRGFDGCGAHVVIAWSDTASDANVAMDQPWTTLITNTFLGTSAVFWRADWQCNYDCYSTPFAIP